MDVTVSSRNIEVTTTLRRAATEKIGRLDRFLDGMERAEVHFSEERNPRIAERDLCEVTMEGHGHHVRAKCAAGDPFAALERTADKLEHQLHRLKSKLVGRSHPRRRAPAPVGAAPVDLPSVDEEAPPAPDPDGRAPAAAQPEPALRIVRTKAFSMEPMTPEEAALQLELLSHSFYFFANAETGRSAVVYRRGAGDVGLIDEAG